MSQSGPHDEILQRLNAELRARFADDASAEPATMASLDGVARALWRIAQEPLEPSDPGPNTAQLGA